MQKDLQRNPEAPPASVAAALCMPSLAARAAKVGYCSLNGRHQGGLTHSNASSEARHAAVAAAEAYKRAEAYPSDHRLTY